MKKLKRFILVLLIKIIEFLEGTINTLKEFYNCKPMRYTIIFFMLMMLIGGYLTR